MKYVALFLIAIMFGSVVFAQQQQKPSEDEVVRVKSNLVNIDVMVKDKKGKYVSDLKAEDFTVVENGVAQKIEFFDAPSIRPADKSTTTAKPETTTTTTVPPSAAPQNYVALVLDSQTTDITNLKQVREGTTKYIREQITDNDVVALLSVTNSLQMLQPFTQDKDKLIAALENSGANSTSKSFEQKDLKAGIDAQRQILTEGAPNGDIKLDSPAGARLMVAQTVLAQFIKLRTALSLQQSRPVLAALAAICEGLRSIPGKKTL
ncbi:MAG TPA: VWA domain-containing protein, partial [Pyrinomonadaceae bacterium]|nr:VWA domain-containing protein [Pyrinomonadaceae bacterium]